MVYDYLQDQDLPAAVQLVDGGLAGINLIRFVENAARVIFVDTVSGFAPDQEILILDLAEVTEATTCSSLGHDDGLLYLLHSLPEVLSNKMPEIYFVGIQGAPRTQLIHQAAETSLQLAMDA